MEAIIESFIDGKHYSYYGGYNDLTIPHHRWADDIKDAKVYTNESDLCYDLAILSNDYTALKFKKITKKDLKCD